MKWVYFLIFFTGSSLFGVHAGVPKRKLRDARRVINGKDEPHRLFPFLVSIEYYDEDHNEWTSTCGGSIVNKMTILTACHCATADEKIHGSIKKIGNPAKRRIVAGTAYWDQDTISKQIARTERIVTHPKCQNFPRMDKSFINDVALYFLKDALVYGPEVQPLRLPSMVIPSAVGYLKNLVNNNTWCTTVGWGQTTEYDDGGHQSKSLTGAPIQLLKPKECRERFCKMINDHCHTDFDEYGQICVASSSASDCFGDSGGPLICNEFVVGVVSYGDSCQLSLPSVYQGLRPILEVLAVYGVSVDETSQGLNSMTETWDDEFDYPFSAPTTRSARVLPADGAVLTKLHRILSVLEKLLVNALIKK